MKSNPLFKIIITGDPNTGKTSLIHQFIHHRFNQTYKPTIGVDFTHQTINDKEVLFWDISGHELTTNITSLYYRCAAAAFVVFDVTNSSSFDSVAKWKHDIDTKVVSYSGKKIPVVLLANKSDLNYDPVSLEKFCNDNGFLTWFNTSAKDFSSISAAVSYIIDNEKTHQIDRISIVPQTSSRSCQCFS